MKEPGNSVWWYCNRCEYEWRDIRPSLSNKPRCPECSSWDVIPALEDEGWTEIRSRIKSRTGIGVSYVEVLQMQSIIFTGGAQGVRALIIT